MIAWDELKTWHQRMIIVAGIGVMAWAVFSKLDTPFHMDAEAGELWAAYTREQACNDAVRLDEQILNAEIRLASENLSAEARALIQAQIQNWRDQRRAIREKYGC